MCDSNHRNVKQVKQADRLDQKVTVQRKQELPASVEVVMPLHCVSPDDVPGG